MIVSRTHHHLPLTAVRHVRRSTVAFSVVFRVPLPLLLRERRQSPELIIREGLLQHSLDPDLVRGHHPKAARSRAELELVEVGVCVQHIPELLLLG